MKRLSSIVVLLFLTLVVVGCTRATSITKYNIVNGKKVECETRDFKLCSLPYYIYTTYDDGTSELVQCYEPTETICPETKPLPTSQSTQCIPNWVYDKLVDKGQAWEVISSQENVNNSPSATQGTFTATSAKTVTVTDDKQITQSFTASTKILIATITASVKQQVNHSVSESVTITIGNSTTLSIPPRETGYGNYGARMQITAGHLYDTKKCEGNKSDMGTDITYVPIDSGWCTWLSSQPDPCPTINN